MDDDKIKMRQNPVHTLAVDLEGGETKRKI